MANYIVSNNTVRIIPEASIDIKPKLPLGTYTVELMPPPSGELFLKRMEDFGKPPRVYGDAETQSDRIIHTFEMRERNTGVLLAGEKGSGKTFLAKYISWKMYEKRYSTILINDQYDTVALSQLIQSISEPCLIIFDEFEKIYTRENEDAMKDPQTGLLTLLDGLLITKKMFIFTCNECERISSMMKNRPGRIFYSLEFGGLSDEVTESYCRENLKNAAHLNEIMGMRKLFEHFTFDMLQAVVEEVNRYDENPLQIVKMMNIIPSPQSSYYGFIVTDAKTGELYDNNYNGDNNVMYASPYDVKVGNLYIWKKTKKNKKAEKIDGEVAHDQRIYIVIHGRDLVGQDGNSYTFNVDKKYKVVMTLQGSPSMRNLWHLADPYGTP
jgi:hypothetical protein